MLVSEVLLPTSDDVSRFGFQIFPKKPAHPQKNEATPQLTVNQEQNKPIQTKKKILTIQAHK